MSQPVVTGLGLILFTLSASASFAEEQQTSELKGRFESSRQLHLSAQVMNSTLQVKGASVSNIASKALIDFFSSRNFAAEIGYFSMQGQSGSTLLSGLEASGKWYPFSPGTESLNYRNDITIRSYSEFSTYVLAGYRLRTLYFETSQVAVSGFGTGAGFDWYAGRKLSSFPSLHSVFINAEVAYDSLSSTSNAKVTALSVATGLGLSL